MFAIVYPRACESVCGRGCVCLKVRLRGGYVLLAII